MNNLGRPIISHKNGSKHTHYCTFSTGPPHFPSADAVTKELKDVRGQHAYGI